MKNTVQRKIFFVVAVRITCERYFACGSTHVISEQITFRELINKKGLFSEIAVLLNRE